MKNEEVFLQAGPIWKQKNNPSEWAERPKYRGVFEKHLT